MIVDSDAKHVRGLADQLMQVNLDVVAAEDGESAFRSCLRLQPDILVTEVELPDMSGFSLCRRLMGNERTANIPLIFSTIREQEIDLVVGFELGAADYVFKSVSHRELVLRIQRILSRSKGGPKTGVVRIGELVIDFDQAIVTRNGRALGLSPTEFHVLAALVKAKGRVLSRLEIIERAWKGEGLIKRRTVDAHIKSLRAKMENPGFDITTIRGLGYCLRLDDDNSENHRTIRPRPSSERSFDERMNVDTDAHQTGGN